MSRSAIIENEPAEISLSLQNVVGVVGAIDTLHVWSFLGDAGWIEYCQEDNDILEAAYKKFQPAPVAISRGSREVYLKLMKESDSTGSNLRDVRRQPAVGVDQENILRKVSITAMSEIASNSMQDLILFQLQNFKRANTVLMQNMQLMADDVAQLRRDYWRLHFDLGFKSLMFSLVGLAMHNFCGFFIDSTMKALKNNKGNPNDQDEDKRK